MAPEEILQVDSLLVEDEVWSVRRRSIGRLAGLASKILMHDAMSRVGPDDVGDILAFEIVSGSPLDVTIVELLPPASVSSPERPVPAFQVVGRVDENLPWARLTDVRKVFSEGTLMTFSNERLDQFLAWQADRRTLRDLTRSAVNDGPGIVEGIAVTPALSGELPCWGQFNDAEDLVVVMAELTPGEI